MPTGRVRFFDPERGFGFITGDDGSQVFLHSSALPAGGAHPRAGARVEYSVADGRKGPQALSVRVVAEAPSVAHAKRRKPRAMVPVVEDLDDLILVAVGEDTQALLVPPALDVVNGLGEHSLQEAGGGLAAAQEDDAGVEEAGEPSGLAGTPGDDNVGVALRGLLQHRLQDPRAEVGEPAVVVDPHHPLVERSEALEPVEGSCSAEAVELSDRDWEAPVPAVASGAGWSA